LNTKNRSINWPGVKRVLVVRLRSIGDTVLATPSLIALKRFLPDAQIDILLEDWVAPLLGGFDSVDNVIAVGKGPTHRLKTAWQIRRNNYDVVFDLHGGTTSTFFTRATGAAHRVGYANYQYSAAYNHLLSSSSDFWQQEKTHSAEQQLALLGFVCVPVEDKPKSRLTVSEDAVNSLREKSLLRQFEISDLKSQIALIHPAAAFKTKQWPLERFARTVEFLHQRGMTVVAVAARNEKEILEELKNESKAPIITFDDLTLPEITALATRAKLFVGNDSGIAHIAAAVKTPTVVIFGASNIDHWHPWTDSPNAVVYSEAACEHFKGKPTAGTEEPKCIRCVTVESVTDAAEQMLLF
jgi:lipopolysaccharide heptosyltransferase II